MLNSAQMKAAEYKSGVDLVIAGAGTGKTKTLVERVKNTILSGVKAENILIFTFSRKAADEISERIRDVTENLPVSGTFHSIAYSIIKENLSTFTSITGYRDDAGIIDESDSFDTLKKLIMKDASRFLGFPVSTVIALMNSDSIDKSSGRKLDESGLTLAFDKLKEEYSEYKRSESLLDFGDLIAYANLLLSDSDIRRSYHQRYTHIFVDEFQDTSPDNMLFIKNLSSGNLFAVGDYRQSIYKFRGAKGEYILKFGEHFPEFRKHELLINFRSHSEIVNLSNDFISSVYRWGRLKSAKGSGGVVSWHMTGSSNAELELISTLASDELELASDVAILARNNFILGKIREHLVRMNPLVESSVTLLTVHSAKGLEFESVIVAGIDDDIFPSRYGDIDEERRLFYVALTRAKLRLNLICRVKGEKLPKFALECGLKERGDVKNIFDI